MRTTYIITNDATVLAELRRRGLVMPSLLVGRQSTSLLLDGRDVFTQSGPADPGFNWYRFPDREMAECLIEALADRLGTDRVTGGSRRPQARG